MNILPKEDGLGSILGRALGAYAGTELRGLVDKRKQQQKAEAIKRFMSSPEYENMPLAQKASLTSTLFGEDIGRTVMQAEGMQQKGLLPEDPRELSGLLKRFGMQQEEADNMADLYSKLTVGGKTKFADILFDKIQRGQLGGLSKSDFESPIPTTEEQKPFSEISKSDMRQYNFPEAPKQFEGMTPKEIVQAKSTLRKENRPSYDQAKEKLKGAQDEGRSLKQLENLNKTGKLPKGAQRINVNWKTGELRVPALANKETQLFVKTVNDFTVKAKDTFGARVTNFELQRFMQRLPTLANTEEGRELIIKQMQTINKLNELYHDSLKKVYQHYGIGNIDAAQADLIAEKLRENDEKRLIDDYNSIVLNQELADEERVLVEINGKRGYVPQNQLDKALRAGAKRL